MIDHVSLGVPDVAAARRFYDPVLSPLDLPLWMSGTDEAAYGRDYPVFWIQKPVNGAAARAGNGVHICFRAPSREAVEAFHRVGLAQGGRDAGAPGLRPHYTHHYYAAFLYDPFGNKIEALYYLQAEADGRVDDRGARVVSKPE